METKKKGRRKLSWDYFGNREKTKPKAETTNKSPSLLSLASQTLWKHVDDWNSSILNKVHSNKHSSSTHDLSRYGVHNSNLSQSKSSNSSVNNLNQYGVYNNTSMETEHFLQPNSADKRSSGSVNELNRYGVCNSNSNSKRPSLSQGASFDHQELGPVQLSGMEPGFTTSNEGSPCLWADTVSEEQITACKIAFSAFDKNGNGEVTWKDFGRILRNLGQNPTEKEIEDVRIDRILQSGTNGTGSMDFPEFITIIAKRFGIDGIDEMENAFRAFDRNGDGLISFAEFKSYNEKIGQFLSDEEINEIIKEVDLDGDGYLNYEEFLKMNR